MSNFRIEFSNPWLLLLLIPAVALALIPYFRIAKRYRRTRNRVISIVLHCLVMLLCISLLAGISFRYTVVNAENQIILLVDASYSNADEKEAKDQFIKSVVDTGGSDYSIGIVKFGFDQKYVAELSRDAKNVYQQYLESEDPDTSATDIASALNYARTLFEYPETSKIVLISDGIETDSKAMDVIRSISADGIKVDTVYFPNETKSEAQIVGAERPKDNISLNEPFNLTLNFQSNFDGEVAGAEVIVYDNGDAKSTVAVELSENEQSVEIEHTFSEYGLHELRFELRFSDGTSDTMAENNSYFSYIYLQSFNHILILEKYTGESAELQTILEDLEYEVDVLSIENDKDSIPTDAKTLSRYEQVIFVNIANSDIEPLGFDEVIEEYVSDLGGGLLTVGGKNDTDADGNVVPHAYNRTDMMQINDKGTLESTTYQKMLPVQVVDYTPPIALVIIIDRSGSMGGGVGSNLDMAKRGADACVMKLNTRDYCGIMTLDDTYSEEVRITPVSQREEIREVIYNISEEGGGGTVFSGAIRRAGEALSSVDVKNRHIMLITDGAPSDSLEEYGSYIDINTAKGITMSVIAINPGSNASNMQAAAERANGLYYEVTSSGQIGDFMFSDLEAKAIAEIEYGKEFDVKIGDVTSVVNGIRNEEIPVLSGYYGTVKKSDAVVPLKGEYGVPIYAQWQYGNGKVGSFMSDLNGEWSAKFINDPVGKELISNIVKNLFPTQDIVPKDIEVNFIEDNYTTNMNVITDLAEGGSVEVQITPLSQDAISFYSGERTIPIEWTTGYTRFTFVITCPGLYQVDISRKDAEGNVTAELRTYKTFSYSEEYNYFPEENAITAADFMASLASGGKGSAIQEAAEIFLTFEENLEREYDPRLLFLILAILLFLLDIAVRKFKFKWIHEIVRDRRTKRSMVEENDAAKQKT